MGSTVLGTMLRTTPVAPYGRIAGVVDITYPPELPVSQRKDDIAQAIRDHQVVIVAGETGSGKTTQLPKICLELGRGAKGRLIGHTQPRRIAARSVAERIAAELGTELGELVGYQVRFTQQTSRAGRVKLMTDGILLAELQRDRQLRKYDTIIIDEAHERSLNIDFLLGYLKRLLPKRPDLKVIITSATTRASRSSATRRRRSATRSRSWPLKGPATSSCSCPASGRSATPPTPSPASTGTTTGGRPSRSSRSTPGCRPPSSTGSSAATRRPYDGSCSPRTSPRRR
jgi:energy-coupling factor transporter ATP-binding protein EcfA2